MAKPFVNPRNLQFLLHEVFGAESLTKHPRFADHNREAFDMALDAALKMAETQLRPYYEEMDRQEPDLHDGQVKVHDAVADMMKAFGEGGWMLTPVPAEHGGLQMPTIVHMATAFIFSAANKAAYNFAGLTMGAARLIRNFGNEELRNTYLPNMDMGKWQGTMCLTEPQAGSSLADIVSTATPKGDGTYLVKGAKIFISAGDYHSIENVVHLVLARIPGSPAGTKGISLFVVPKLRPEGGKLVPNDVMTAGVYHKMGEKGTPALHIQFGDNGGSIGWLVGEANRGLSYMFQMMNEARLGVGLSSTAVTTAAYHASLEYARERPQGRSAANRDPQSAQQLIIDHADVRRMLLMQKAVAEGSLGLLLQLAMYEDLTHTTEGDDKARYAMLLDLLTPIAKTYPSEHGILAISAAMQVFGGYGYCRDFPVEQYYRDVKINTIYEGTTGIQSMDLLGRKVTMNNGAAMLALGQEIGATVQEAMAHERLKAHAEALGAAAGKLQAATMHLLQYAMKGELDTFLADANLYMEAASIVVIGWQWLKQGIKAQQAMAAGASGTEKAFYEGKLVTLDYFFAYEVPMLGGYLRRLQDGNPLTVKFDPAVLS